MSDSAAPAPSGETPWRTCTLGKERNEIANDGMEIRLLLRNDLASVVHCYLGAGETGRPTYNSGINEIWYFTAGQGELWRQHREPLGPATVDVVAAGTCVTIPDGVAFQLRNTGEQNLTFLCITTPPWSSPEQNQLLSTGRWPTTL